MHHLVILEIRRLQEEGLKTLFRTGNHGCIISEQQAAQDGNGRNRIEVEFTTMVSIIHDKKD